MATKIIYVDDIDGSDGAATIEFSLQGKDYTIDLAEKNLAKLHQALAPYIEKARKSRTTASSVSKTKRRGNTTEIREWLRANGHKVPDRGAIRGDLLKLWEDR
ncbi:lsr2 domain-containing protein [Ditylenchus destructor]|nr:lsr2 domain-containing protein [Ditylenchus destructor]